MASKVVNHELNKYVLPFNRISVDNQKIRGLTKPMKRIFFKGFKKPQTRKTWSSKKLGTLVHSQVEKVIKKRPLKKPHAFTSQIIKFLQGYSNLHSEVPLLSPSGYFLTYSDVICESSKGLTVISLKTGYNQSYNKGLMNCKHLPTKLSNSYKTHHQLQLALEVACIEQDYKLKVGDAFVLYVGYGPKKKLKVDPLGYWARTDKAQKFLLHCMNKQNKKMFY